MDVPVCIFPKYVFSIGKYFSANPNLRPTLSSICVRGGYIEATDSFKAIRVTTDIEGEFVISKEKLINEETYISDISKEKIKLQGKGLYEIPLMNTNFPKTEDFYKKGENYTIVDLGMLIDTLKCIKDIGVKKIKINIGNPLSPVIITTTDEDKDSPYFEALIMPLKY